MDRDFIAYLLATVLAIIIGGYVLRTQIAEPLLEIVDQTAASIATAGR